LSDIEEMRGIPIRESGGGTDVRAYAAQPSFGGSIEETKGGEDVDSLDTIPALGEQARTNQGIPHGLLLQQILAMQAELGEQFGGLWILGNAFSRRFY